MRSRRAKSRTSSSYANVIEQLESRYLLTDLIGDTPATATDLGVLTAGQPLGVFGRIDEAFDLDVYQFQVGASETGTIELFADFSSLDAFVRLLDSSGNELDFDNDSGPGTDSLLRFTLDGGETYFIEASDFLDGTGDFYLTISLDVGDSIPTAHDLGLLADSQSLAALGVIDQAFDRDVFRFQADTSGSVLVELSADFSLVDSIFFNTVVTVLDSFGSEIAFNDNLDGDFFNTNSRLTFAAVAGETYFVVVEGFSNGFFSSTGGYSLHIKFDVGFDPATATNLETLTETQEVLRSGTITAGEVRDLLLFTAATTGTVEVRQTSAPVTGLSLPFDGVLQAFRVDSGIPIATDFGSFDTTIPRVVTFSVVAGQSYFAEVTGFGGSVGDYQLQISYIRDDVPAAGVDLAFVAGRQSIVRFGSIEARGDIDTYHLAGTSADQTLQIALTADDAAGSFLDPVLVVRIFANANATTPLRTLTNNDFGFSFNSFLAVPVPAGQRVEIDAQGFRTSRGAYVLTITSSNGIAVTTPILAGDPAIGSIEASFSTDVFQFTPNETGTAVIDVTSFDAPNVPLGAIGDPVVTIHETNTGNFVAFDDDSGPGFNSLVMFSVTMNTSYEVEVGGFGSNTGNYRVTLNLAGGTDDANTFDQATPLSLGNTPGKSLFSPSDVDVFSFVATFNGTVNVRVSPSDPNEQTGLQVGLSAFQASPTGNSGDVELLEVPRAPSPGQPTELFVPVSQGRTYFFRVAGLNNQSGGYSLDVSAQVDRVAGGLPNNDPTAPQPGEIRIANGQGALLDPTVQSIDFPTDRDWYRIVAPQPGVFTINLNRDFDYQDPLLTVYSDTGLPIARNDEIVSPDGRRLSLNSQLTLQAVRTGEVFFVEAADLRATAEEFAANPGRPRTYQLDVQFAAQAADDFGNDPGHIFLIPEQSPGRFAREGILGADQDRDFFAFTAVVGGTFNMQLATNGSAPLPPGVQLQIFELEAANILEASLENLTQVASVTTSTNTLNGLSLSNLAVPRAEGESTGSIRNFVVVVSHVGEMLDSDVNYTLNVNVEQGNSTRDLALQNAALFALLSLADGAASLGDQNPIAINAAIQAAMNELGKSGSFLVVLLDPVNDPVLTDSAGRQTGFTSNTGTLNGVPGGYASVGSFGQVLIVPIDLSQPGSASLQFAGIGSLSQAQSSFSAFVVGPSGSAPVSQEGARTTANVDGKGNFVVQLGFGDSTSPVVPIPTPGTASGAQSPSFFMMTNAFSAGRGASSDSERESGIEDSVTLRSEDELQQSIDRQSEKELPEFDWSRLLDEVLEHLQFDVDSRQSIRRLVEDVQERGTMLPVQLVMNSDVGRSARVMYDVLKYSAGWVRNAKPTSPAPKQRTTVPKVTQETRSPKDASQTRIASKKTTHLGG